MFPNLRLVMVALVSTLGLAVAFAFISIRVAHDSMVPRPAQPSSVLQQTMVSAADIAFAPATFNQAAPQIAAVPYAPEPNLPAAPAPETQLPVTQTPAIREAAVAAVAAEPARTAPVVPEPVIVTPAIAALIAEPAAPAHAPIATPVTAPANKDTAEPAPVIVAARTPDDGAATQNTPPEAAPRPDSAARQDTASPQDTAPPPAATVDKPAIEVRIAVAHDDLPAAPTASRAGVTEAESPVALPRANPRFAARAAKSADKSEGTRGTPEATEKSIRAENIVAVSDDMRPEIARHEMTPEPQAGDDLMTADPHPVALPRSNPRFAALAAKPADQSESTPGMPSEAAATAKQATKPATKKTAAKSRTAKTRKPPQRRAPAPAPAAAPPAQTYLFGN